MTAASDLAHALGRPEQHGQRWRCLCPAHADSTPSLDIDTTPDGRLLFVCRAGCDNGNIIASLTSRGLWPLQDAAPRRSDRPRHREWGDPTEVYTYRDRDGATVGLVCRWDVTIDGRLNKHILPYIEVDGRWMPKGMPAPIPLYGLRDVLARPSAQVIVVEGERKRDDLAGILGDDFAVVSWAHGAKSPQKTDWSPLTGRRVVLWPDNDDPGDQATSKIAGILASLQDNNPERAAAASDHSPASPVRTQIKYLRRDPVKPKGWDASDAIRTDGWDAEQILKWASERAEVWTRSPAKKMEAQPRDSRASKSRGETPNEGKPSVTHQAVANQAASATITQFKPRSSAVPIPEPETPPNFSDDFLAREFERRHSDDLRFVAEWGHWYRWSGTFWKQEKTLLAFDCARAVCREAAVAIDTAGGKGAKSIASGKTIAAVVSIARAARSLAAVVDQWDVDTWLLNTPSSTIDLRTGLTRPARQDDYITKTTAVAPDASHSTPIWDTFLSRITDGDQSLIDFLRRMAGYSLTGDTREHALFFLYGLGANGKSTFLNAITGCLGDYAVTSPIETFTETRNDRHLTELARLRGARLVTATETTEGRRWAESKIKALTGGDRIAANFMRQDYFEFTPQFKLVIAGNHKPGLRSVDEAIRRRFNLIPFTAAIPKDERDPDLGGKLRAEWPGILQWMIDGCVEWQELGGLAAPETVGRATDEYLEAEDAIAAWLDEKCLQGDFEDSSGELYASWKAWAETNGEYAGPIKQFIQKMEGRGFERKRNKAERLLVGLKLISRVIGSSHWYDERNS